MQNDSKQDKTRNLFLEKLFSAFTENQNKLNSPLISNDFSSMCHVVKLHINAFGDGESCLTMKT